MKHWLDGFAYHVELSWMVFALAGLLSVAVALITVSYQAGRVGLVNPAKTLRAE
jgi:putative ABC transport system permease protein